MAKKRKKRPPTTRPSGGSKAAGSTSTGSKTSGTASKASGSAGSKASTTRPVTPTAEERAAAEAAAATKAEQALNRVARKELARKQREALRRKIARRRIYKRVAIGAGVAGALAGIVFLVSTAGGETLTEEMRTLLSRAPQAAQAAGCDDVQTIAPFDPAEQDRSHIGGEGAPAVMPPFSEYPSIPPTSGPHAGSTVSAAIYETPPPVDGTIHSLEHGAAIVWYARDADAEALTEVQRFFRDNQDHVIVAPFDYPDQGPSGQLPDGKKMALVAWHRARFCDEVSLPVAFEFAHEFATAPYSDYGGEAPEPGLTI